MSESDKESPFIFRVPGVPAPKRRRREPASSNSGEGHGAGGQSEACAWLPEVVPKRSPYSPQVGDDLVYFRQGHAAFMEVVKRKSFGVPAEVTEYLPYVANTNLAAAVSVRLVDMVVPPFGSSFINLKLAETNWTTGDETGWMYYIQYPHNPKEKVMDFLVLRQIYDKFVDTHSCWKFGDRFRCLIGRVWVFGTIVSVEALEGTMPYSKFGCLKVTWDKDGTEARLSPWDVDVVLQDQGGNQNLPTDEELRKWLYQPTSKDWPPNVDQGTLCAKVARLIEKLMTLPESQPFNGPMKKDALPMYIHLLTFPMDLITIKARLENRFYHCLDSLMYDIELILRNTERMNHPSKEIRTDSKIIRDVCLELVRNPDVTDVQEVYKKTSDKYIHLSSIRPEGMRLISFLEDLGSIILAQSLGNVAERSSQSRQLTNLGTESHTPSPSSNSPESPEVEITSGSSIPDPDELWRKMTTGHCKALKSVTFDCRSVRIGSYIAFSAYADCFAPVTITELGFKVINLQRSLNNESVSVCIPMEAILEIKGSLASEPLSILFVTLRPDYAKWLRKKVGLEEGGSVGSHLTSEDDDGGLSPEKRIIAFLIQRINQCRTGIREVLGKSKVFLEIGPRDAQELLKKIMLDKMP